MNGDSCPGEKKLVFIQENGLIRDDSNGLLIGISYANHKTEVSHLEKQLAELKTALVNEFNFSDSDLVDTSDIPEWTEETFDKAVKGRFLDSEKRSWSEFRDSGLLWYVNRMLHLFGWALKFQMANDEIIGVYPSKCKFRGFSEDIETNGFKKLTNHLAENMETLLKDVEE